MAVVIGNIPMIYPLFRRTMQKMGFNSMFTTNGSYQRSGAGPSMQLHDRKAAHKNKFGHPLSRSTFTDSDSAEHIVERGEVLHRKDGINITTETAVVTSTSPADDAEREQMATYPHSHYGKPAGAGYSFHVSSKSRGEQEGGYHQHH